MFTPRPDISVRGLPNCGTCDDECANRVVRVTEDAAHASLPVIAVTGQDTFVMVQKALASSSRHASSGSASNTRRRGHTLVVRQRRFPLTLYQPTSLDVRLEHAVGE